MLLRFRVTTDAPWWNKDVATRLQAQGFFFGSFYLLDDKHVCKECSITRNCEIVSVVSVCALLLCHQAIQQISNPIRRSGTRWDMLCGGQRLPVGLWLFSCCLSSLMCQSFTAANAVLNYSNFESGSLLISSLPLKQKLTHSKPNNWLGSFQAQMFKVKKILCFAFVLFICWSGRHKPNPMWLFCTLWFTQRAFEECCLVGLFLSVI